MDAKTCIEKLKLIASVSMATVDEYGNPQVRIIGVMHTEEERLYFLTARGKPFYKELLSSNRVQILGMSRFKETIRLDGIPERLPQTEQSKWLDLIFEENPYMQNVYPGASRRVLEVFCVQNGSIEYFHLGVRPIFREIYTIGSGIASVENFVIADSCIACGKCAKECPQSCIKEGSPYRIEQEHCLRCGLCAEVCPSSAISSRRQEHHAML